LKVTNGYLRDSTFAVNFGVHYGKKFCCLLVITSNMNVENNASERVLVSSLRLTFTCPRYTRGRRFQYKDMSSYWQFTCYEHSISRGPSKTFWSTIQTSFFTSSTREKPTTPHSLSYPLDHVVRAQRFKTKKFDARNFY
jgi:hypothetical protein